MSCPLKLTELRPTPMLQIKFRPTPPKICLTPLQHKDMCVSLKLYFFVCMMDGYRTGPVA